MNNKSDINVSGYIEGYYGRLLSWDQRKRIVLSLKEKNMTSYFYAPKEDLKHRLNWRKPYGKVWRKEFKEFTKFSTSHNIQVIAGIAPGIDFNFSFLQNPSGKDSDNDFFLLLDKAQQLLLDGAYSIALLLDDIPTNFNKVYGAKKSEGFNHAFLINKLSQSLNKQTYFVPRVYADELVEDSPKYLFDLGKEINKNIKIFYCGKYVVCQTINNNHFNYIKSLMSNDIIIWDNFYANDYCPRRLFLGPWKGRSHLKNVFINPTGMLETDLFILDIVYSCLMHSSYEKALIKNNIPLDFKIILNFFSNPNTNDFIKNKKININDKTLKVIDFLLWEWKSKIAIEWYPFLMGLKHDIQLYNGSLDMSRILKTQTNPLANKLLKCNY